MNMYESLNYWSLTPPIPPAAERCRECKRLTFAAKSVYVKEVLRRICIECFEGAGARGRSRHIPILSKPSERHWWSR